MHLLVLRPLYPQADVLLPDLLVLDQYTLVLARQRLHLEPELALLPLDVLQLLVLPLLWVEAVDCVHPAL